MLKKESFDVSIMYFALASITKVMFSSLRIKRSNKIWLIEFQPLYNRNWQDLKRLLDTNVIAMELFVSLVHRLDYKFLQLWLVTSFSN